MKSRQHIHLLTSSPKANGFYKGGTVKKYIPGIYRVNELNMLKKYQSLPNDKRPEDFAIYEYSKGDWTFHGKGAWVYEDRSKNAVDLTIIGSSNFSYRSNRRDNECQLYIFSECKDLKLKLHNEAQNLFENSIKVDVNTVKNGGGELGYHKLTWKERWLNRLFASFI